MADGRLIAGRYEVLAEIGRGGMGMVARAYDHRLATEVAIKVLRPDLSRASVDKDSLVKEARVLARLTHPSIVRLFDLADTEVGLMLVLEYVKGPNLAQVIERRVRLSEREVLHVARQVCAGLSAAHAEGVIHRDLKPPNLLVAPGSANPDSPDYLLNAQIKITDFGISKLLASRVQSSGASPGTDATLSAAGTPVYMAPEQFRGNPCTPATDVYALGVIVYQVLAGLPPFTSPDVNQLAMQHFRTLPQPISGCTPGLNAVIQRALSKAPADRFQTAGEFLDALEQAVAPPPLPLEIPVLEPDALDRAATWARRRWWIVALVVVAIFAIPIAFVVRSLSEPQATASGSPAPAPLELGKVIELPTDIDMTPVASQLPAPSAVNSRPRLPGPHRKPHAVWTALSQSTPTESRLWVDGVGPDGTAYIRDEAEDDRLLSMWAVNDQGIRWGYRAPENPLLARSGMHSGSWPGGSHVDFRDRGRVWLSRCLDTQQHCDGVVFNFTGVGGVNREVPAALREKPESDSGESSDFERQDAQNGYWPRDYPRFNCTSRLGVVTLARRGEAWSAPLDGGCSTALDAGGRLVVATVRNTVYVIAAGGKVEWTYTCPFEIHAMKALPSGDVLLLVGKGHQMLEAIHAGAARWQFEASGWIHDLGAVDSTGALYFSSASGIDHQALYGLNSAGEPMWSVEWSGPIPGSDKVRLDEGGRLYLSDARFEVGGKQRAGVVCFSE